MGKSAPEGRPGDGSSVSDEEWAEFLRAAGQTGQAEARRRAAPEDALKLLEPLQPEVRGMLGRALSEPRKDQDPLSMFSRFDPAEVRLVGDVIKTRGRMTFGKGERGPGEVLVRADYTFVYPLVKARPGALQVERTIVRRQLTVALSDPAKWETTPGTLAVVDYQMDISNSDCFTYDGFLHPAFDEDTATEAPTGSPVDPYDRSRGISDREEGCRPVSRT